MNRRYAVTPAISTAVALIAGVVLWCCLLWLVMLLVQAY